MQSSINCGESRITDERTSQRKTKIVLSSHFGFRFFYSSHTVGLLNMISIDEIWHHFNFSLYLSVLLSAVFFDFELICFPFLLLCSVSTFSGCQSLCGAVAIATDHAWVSLLLLSLSFFLHLETVPGNTLLKRLVG